MDISSPSLRYASYSKSCVLALLFICVFWTTPLTALECRTVEGLGVLPEPGRLVLLGELHGTEEMPELVLDFICEIFQKKMSVAVLLEIPVEETDLVANYLASDGSALNRSDLLAGDFWQRNFQDGRSSKAMLNLIDVLRQWRSDGLPLQVFLIDPGAGTGRMRDRGMANLVLEAVGNAPEHVFVALTGNIHNRLESITLPDGETFKTMVQYLREAEPFLKLTSLRIKASGGSAWYCTNECGVKMVPQRDVGETPRLELDSQAGPRPYNGLLYVGSVTASLPAAAPSESLSTSGKSDGDGG